MLKVQDQIEAPWNQLPVGAHRKLKSLQGSGEVRARLLELGFVVGSDLELIAKGPFGSPYVIKVRGTTVALRWDEVQCLII